MVLIFTDGNCVSGFNPTSEVNEEPLEAGFGSIEGGTNDHLFLVPSLEVRLVTFLGFHWQSTKTNWM